MPRIFISYATHDLNYAATLYSGLAMRNIDLWFAPVCIKSGENFVEQIANALKNIEDEDDKVRSAENCKSCDIFIFLLSKYSMDSTWCHTEFTTAKSANKKIYVLRLDNAPINEAYSFLITNTQFITAYHLPQNVMNDFLDTIEAAVSNNSGIPLHDTMPHILSCDLKITDIADGDPFFKYGSTLKTSLSEYSFFLAPPFEILTDEQRSLLNSANKHFASSETVFSTSLKAECEKTGIDDLFDRIQNSKKKVLLDFVNNSNGCYFNNKKYGICSINPFLRKEDLREQGMLSLEFYETDYYTHRVMKDVCKQLYAEAHPFFSRLTFTNIQPYRILFTSLGLNILLFESNNGIDIATVLTKRSANSAETNKDAAYSLSVIEGVSLSDYDTYNNTVNLKLAVERGIKEELGVDESLLKSDSIEFLSLFANMPNLELGLCCAVKLQSDITIKDYVIPSHGKDEKLEVEDKFVCSVSDLPAFTYKHKDEVLPQAIFTIGKYLQTMGNDLLVQAFGVQGAKEERFISGKNTDRPCGDAIFESDDFIAVIDGATPKGSLDWDGLPADTFVAQLLKSAMANLPSNVAATQAITILNEAIAKCYADTGRTNLPPEELLQASIVIYSRARKEIWSYGDCKYMINGTLRSQNKSMDELLSKMRSLYLQSELLLGKTQSELMENDTGRQFILPLLKRQTLFMNTPGQYGYPVLSGEKLCEKLLKVIHLKLGDHVVLSSDGYPELYPSLEQSEYRLKKILRDDPLCMKTNMSTKCLKRGNLSYDDRSYISFFVR